MQSLTFNRGANGEGTFAIPSPDYVSSFTLSAGVAKDVTIPANGNICIFSATDDFYAAYGGTTATLPVGDVDDGTAFELNPVIRNVSRQATLSIISPTSSNQVTISFYS